MLAGSYPALFLSGFNPVQVLKGTAKACARRRTVPAGTGGGAVLFSILLIIATIIVFQQINYLRNRPLGYDKDNLMMVYTGQHARQLRKHQRDLLQVGGVSSVTKSSQSVFEVGSNTGDVH